MTYAPFQPDDHATALAWSRQSRGALRWQYLRRLQLYLTPSAQGAATSLCNGCAKLPYFGRFGRNVLKERTVGVPGQKDRWRGRSQWTSMLNADGDRIGIYVGNLDLLWLYIRSGLSADRATERTERARQYSWIIQQTMGDQQLGDNLEASSKGGWSITVERPWVRDDEDEWPDAVVWIKEQQERLAAIVSR